MSCHSTSRRRSLRHWVTLSTAAATAWPSHGQGVEVEVKPREHSGLYVAKLEVGTPLQTIWAQVHTASALTLIPEADGTPGSGFSITNSSSADKGKEQHFTLPDGLKLFHNLTFVGVMLHETVQIGGKKLDKAPLLLARNLSGDVAPPRGVGVLGLCMQSGAGPRIFSEAVPYPAQSSESVGGFMDHFWKMHPEVPKTYRLELGGSRPRFVLGDEAVEGPRAEGGVRYLASTFTAVQPHWYVSVRAIGLSQGKESPFLQWNLDFNLGLPNGSPTLLDSGTDTIQVGSAVYQQLLLSMPGCTAEKWGTTCDCEPATISTDFPSISISFEASSAFRIAGLDSGADVIACIPPEAYIKYDDKKKKCVVAIVDGGPRHKMFRYEAMVLGMPFFRSIAVFFDVERRRVGLGTALTPVSSSPAVGGSVIVGMQEQCSCADPKNWWSTGKRFSPKRVVVVLVGTALFCAYVFVAHSPSATAQHLKSLANGAWEGVSGACGGALGIGSTSPGGSAPNGGAAASGSRHEAPGADRPFIQMAGRGGPE